MAANVGEWSSTPADNTSLGSVSLLENVMLVNAVNNAFREMMAQVATGIAAGDFTTLGADLTDLIARWTPASASTAASLDFAEDTDNGTNRARVSAPAALGSDVDLTWPDVTGTLLVGALGSTDNRLLRSDGTGGKLAQASAVTVDDSGNMSGVGTFAAGAITSTGNLTVTGTSAGVMALQWSDDSNAGLTMTARKISASPAANDIIATYSFQGRDDAAANREFCTFLAQISDPAAGAIAGRFNFTTMQAGASASRMNIGGGLYHSSATGTDKGNNTINFGAVYDDNVLLTDYVFDKWLGIEQGYSWRVQEKADALDTSMFSVEAHVAFMRENRRLYGLPDLNDAIDGVIKEHSLGAMIQKLWQSLELANIHIAEMHDRIKSLEGSGRQ